MSLSQFQRFRRFVLAFLILGILGRLWSTLYIGNRKAQDLVDIGPYSVTRNPLYVFSSVAAAGVGAQTGSLVLSVFFLVATIAAFHLVILREESYLKDAFGAPYEAYLARVPRFWPAFGRWRDEPTLSISTGRLYKTFLDGLVFFAAKPAFEATEYLQAVGVIPVLLRLP